MKKIIIGIIMSVAAVAAQAATSAFTYQGVLMNEAGNAPLTGNKTIELRLYNAATGGTPIWGRTYNVLLDQSGLFNVEVSDADGTEITTNPKPPSGATLPKALGDSRNKWVFIGLTVSGSSGEIVPRQKLLPVPYATVAADVSAASGNFTVAGTLTAANASIADTIKAKSINVTSAVGASTLSTTGAVTVGGDLKVAGAITGYGTVPVGGIILWSGAENAIPNGYALCNGQTVNGRKTPDLRGRFVVGAGQGGGYSVGNTGGANSVALTESQMPKHRHEYIGDDQLDGRDGNWTAHIRVSAYTYDAISTLNNGYGRIYGTSYVGGRAGDYVGSAEAHENRPPYYALCFIMRTR